MTPLRDNPTDPALDALLDKALAPQSPPADLAQRIVAHTTPMLDAPAVIGRIGFPLWRAAVAAVLLAAVSVVFVLFALDQTGGNTGPRGPVVIDDPQPGAVEAAADDQVDWAALEQMAQADEQASASIDQQIDLLSLHVEYASVVSEWSTNDQLLDEALMQNNLELLAGNEALMF
jgi:hypothetical protein